MIAPDIYIRRPRPARSPFSLTRRKILLAIPLAIIAAAIVAMLTYRQRIDGYLLSASGGVKMLALSFSDEQLAALDAAPGIANTEARQKIKARFDRVRATNPGVIAVQLLRYDTRARKTTCLVGSPKHDGPGASAEVAAPPELDELLRDGGPDARLVAPSDRPYLIYGYAVAIRRPVAVAGYVYILHYQIDARPRIAEALAAAAWRAAGVLFLFCLPFAVYGITRGSSRQERTLNELMVAIEQSEIAFAIGTLEQHNIYANDGLVRQYGYSREELSRIKYSDMMADKPADVDAPWRALFQPGAKARTHHLMLKRKNGEIFPARISLTPLHIKQPNGREIFRCITISTDLTEFSRSNRLLEAARHRAEEASRAKSSFIAMMGHEVRTPLNGIVGFASLLLDTPLAPAQTACVQAIRKHGQALVQIAGEVLDISRLESGALHPALHACDPIILTLEALDAADDHSGEKRTRFHTNIHPELPDMLLVDSARLRHVLINLALSAVRHIRSGDIEISLQKKAATVPAPGAVPSTDTFTMEISVCATSDARAGGGAPPDASATLTTGMPGPQHGENAPFSLMIARRLTSLMGCEIASDDASPGRFVFIFSIQCRPCAEANPGLPADTRGCGGTGGSRML